MKCANCGMPVPDAKVCPYCGHEHDLLDQAPGASTVWNLVIGVPFLVFLMLSCVGPG